MNDDAVHYAVDGGIATLTMDQPETRNALTPELLDGLWQGLAAASSEPSVRLVVLTHTGSTFCAGADLRGATTAPPRHDLVDVLTAILDCPKPVVGRIGGHCMGGGVGLAAACDLSVASSESRFGFTEVRLGVAPAIISVVVLPKLCRGDALELFLTGERIEAGRAAEAGLITRSVPAAALDAAVDHLVSQLLRGGPQALGAAKGLVFDVPAMDRDEAFHRTAELSRSLFASAEAAEGMAAFRERRHPSWVPGDDV